MSDDAATVAAVVGPELEAPRPAPGGEDGFSDAVTFAFGDRAAGVFGLARAGLANGQASGLALLFSGRDVAAVRAEGGVEPIAPSTSWEAVDAAGVTTRVLEPLRRWSVAFDGSGEGDFELEFAALGEPASIEGGGMTSYEHLCSVRGRARVATREVAVSCLGQRGHAWGAPDWSRMTLARTVGAWLGPDLAVVASAVRGTKAHEHADEALSAVVLEGDPVAPVTIGDPRLSTTYDAEGRQRRAGFELWLDDEAAGARRGAGEVLCGTSLDLGRLRLDCAFFAWRMEGREGVGRYDVLRRVA